MLAEKIASNLMADLSRADPCAREGALLSFIPTLSSGMSPALRETTQNVLRKYPSTVEMALAWD